MTDAKNEIRGFTLIEILIVIAIIGILLGIVLVGFSGVRAAARDAVRMSDLQTLKKMLEMYKGDQDRYPTSTIDFQIEGQPWGANWQGYGIVPKDPLSPTQDYAYVSDEGRDYQVYAKFERESVNPTFACAEPCGPSAEYDGGLASVGTSTLIAFEPPPPPPPPGEEYIVCDPPFPEAMKGEQVYSISGRVTNPRITRVTIDPLDVSKFAWQTVTVSARDTAGHDITALEGQAYTDNSSFLFGLELISGAETNGVWSGEWNNEDEYCDNYQLAIRAVSASGVSEAVLTFR